MYFFHYIRSQLAGWFLNYQDKDKADKVSAVTLGTSASAFTLGDANQKILRLVLTVFGKTQGNSEKNKAKNSK